MKTFWLDRDLDRYLAAVRLHVAAFDDVLGDISPVLFACRAWQLAVPPALNPGYVRWHPRVLCVACTRNSWDGGLTGRVELVSPLPTELTVTRTWWRDRGWRGWPELFGQYVRPTEQDLSRSPHLRATLLAEAPLPVDRLPAAPETRDGVEAAARRAVTVLVRELSDLVAPIVNQLDGVGGR